MKTAKRNIIYIGDDYFYKHNLKLYDIKERTDDLYHNPRFPHLVKVNQLAEIKRKQGFLLVLTLDDLQEYFPDVVDVYTPNVYEIDRNIRRLFKNFEYVILITIEGFDYGRIPFSNIYVEFANKYFDTPKGLNLLIEKLYQEYISKKETKLSKIKLANIEKLKTYIKKNRKTFITTKEIMKDLNVNEKWLQRYMKEMNKLYNNIGYNKIKRVWYVVKNNYKKLP